MQDPNKFYVAQLRQFELQLGAIKKKLALSSTIRLLLFLVTAFGIYFFFGQVQPIIITLVLGIGTFLFVLSRHANLQYNKALTERLIAINKTEINVLKGDYLDLDEGHDFIDPSHPFSYDIDLFGRGSFFQYINRTATKEGRNHLAQILTENTISKITSKQEVVAELAKKRSWSQRYAAIASLIKVKHPAKAILDWITEYKAVIPACFSSKLFELKEVLSISCRS